jgi:hypothetical protein
MPRWPAEYKRKSECPGCGGTKKRNANRCNNDLSNLELMTRGAHSRLHRKLDSHTRKRDAGRFA